MATLDLITLQEAKTAINMSGTAHDAEIATYITAVSLRIDDLVGPVVRRSVSETHNGGRCWIVPKLTPVSAVTTLVEYRDSDSTSLTVETNASKPADAFLLDDEWTHNVRIIRRSVGSDRLFPAGRRNIELTYTAGRFADTSSVGANFKQAAALTVQHLWRPAAGAWAQSPQFLDAIDPPTQTSPVAAWAVPRAVKELLADDLKPQAVA